MSDEGDMLICPYNRSHVISKLRMGRHLVKCQANHPNVILATCYYDFLHRVPPEKLNEHLETCPSKFQFQVRFCTGEKSSDGLDPNVQNIFLTRNNLKSEKGENSAKTPKGGGYEGPAHSNHSLTRTESKGQERISESSAMRMKTHGSDTLLGRNKTNPSSEPKMEFNTNSSFLLKCSISDPKGSKGKDKKEKTKNASKPKEESWDTDSSEDSSEEAKQGTSTSSTTFYNGDNGRSHTGSSNSFHGDDFVNKDGFVTVYAKQKSKRKNVK